MTAVCTASSAAPASGARQTRTATYMVFSDELDKHLMAFTLANAAAASGVQVTMFFSFWGVAALRAGRPAKGKNLIERMFGAMLPRGPRELTLSKMHFGGLGRWLIRRRMAKCGMASLEQLIETAELLGVKFQACDASLKLMGLRREELRPSVEVAGATACVASSCESDVAMVI